MQTKNKLPFSSITSKYGICSIKIRATNEAGILELLIQNYLLMAYNMGDIAMELQS